MCVCVCVCVCVCLCVCDVIEGGSKMRVRGWTKEDEKRQKLSFLREELSAYCIPEGQAADCGEDIQVGAFVVRLYQ